MGSGVSKSSSAELARRPGRRHERDSRGARRWRRLGGQSEPFGVGRRPAGPAARRSLRVCVLEGHSELRGCSPELAGAGPPGGAYHGERGVLHPAAPAGGVGEGGSVAFVHDYPSDRHTSSVPPRVGDQGGRGGEGHDATRIESGRPSCGAWHHTGPFEWGCRAMGPGRTGSRLSANGDSHGFSR